MSVIARFRVSEVKPYASSTSVSLHAMHSPDGFEDDETLKEIRSFYEATPNGQLTMTIRNQAAEEQFQVNDEFYLRLEKIPTDKTVQAIYARRSEEMQKNASDSS